MRKVRPQDVKSDFDALVDERLKHFRRIEAALRGTQHEKRDMSLLSETTLHSCYVAFECFISDLLLAYVNRDASKYQSNLESKINSSVNAKFGSWAASRIQFSTVKHIKLSDLETLLDPDDYNVTFKDVAALKQRFHDWVAVPYKNAVVGISDSDERLIDLAHAIRNYIAHKSTASKDLMNARLANVSTGPGCPNLHLQRGPHQIHDVGAYLKSIAGGERRVIRLITRLRNIAANF